MNMMRAWIYISLLCIMGWAQAAEFTGKVITVMDGDTLLVLQDGHPVKVRLAEVDAPEKLQPYGAASQQSLAKMVMGKQIQVSSRAIDDYGRMIATVRLAELNINHEQVRLGMAWEYSRYHNNRVVMALQRDAQQAKRGLWAGDDIVEPAQWRKLNPATFVSDTVAPKKSPRATLKADPAPRLNSSQACAKKHCSEMTTCAEARDYLSRCGIKTLDGDGDGMPCEQLCMPRQEIKK